MDAFSAECVRIAHAFAHICTQCLCIVRPVLVQRLGVSRATFIRFFLIVGHQISVLGQNRCHLLVNTIRTQCKWYIGPPYFWGLGLQVRTPNAHPVRLVNFSEHVAGRIRGTGYGAKDMGLWRDV